MVDTPALDPAPLDDPWLRSLFETEVEVQCRFAMVSAEQVNHSLRSREQGDLIWYWLQNLLVASANISKLLWGKNQTVAAQRVELRADLGISEEREMAIKARQLRNSFEHFDDRLIDRFSDPAVPRIFVGRIVGPAGMVTIGGASAADEDWFRRFDPDTGVVSFWDWKVDLNQVMQEVTELFDAIQTRRRRPSPRG